MTDGEDKENISSGAVLKFITFGLGREKFGISIDEAREIIADYNIVPLPRSPEFIEGIISLRGDIIPIVDMRARFEMAPGERDEETRIIVLEMQDFSVGIQVDKVYEVLKLPEDTIEPPPKLVGGLKGDYIDGVVEVKDKLTIILNLDEIFSATEKIVMKEGLGLKGPLPAERSEEPASVEAETKKSSEPPSYKVSSSGQISIRGKSYYIGKKHIGAMVNIFEDNEKMVVCKEGENIKEFET
ncbi:MAG: chemotaxis protein CheW [Deltaproteobacteria bacterium]|nr:chemotaxis protein CheW [Deltaproteobacteria bacterium]